MLYLKFLPLLCIIINAHTKIAVNVWADFDKLNLNWFLVMKADFDKGTKICSKCKRELPIENFQKNCAATDGLTCRCKECLSAKNLTEEERKRRVESVSE